MTIAIKSIELINFMCHENLRIVFDKKITCIGGRNGTGKSAVMISLGILFGQRAQSLERGNSYANLIKTGCNQSIIKVTINNYLNYQIDKYGKTVTIEKKLRLASSKVSLYNERGRLFNVTKAELDNIIEKYSLKFDNPFNFLTQENSKKFLNVCKPEQLYDLYYRGTELKTVNEELESSGTILNEMKEKLNETMIRKKELQSRLIIQKSKLEYLNFDAEAELKSLELEEKWNEAVETRRRAEEITDIIQKLDGEIEELKRDKEGLAETKNFEFQEKSTGEIDKQIDDDRLQLHRISAEHKDYLSQKESYESSLQQIKDKSRIKPIKLRIGEVERELEIKSDKYLELEKHRETFYDLLQKERIENEAKEQRAYAIKKQIEYFKRHAHDSGVEATINKFMEVERELSRHSFNDQVIGPISKFIRLRENKWYKPVSIVLKRALDNYMVFNSQDKVRLFNIFKKLNVNYSILQVSSKNVCKNYEKNKNFKTLLDVLEADEPLVLSQLIMLNGIEQIILVESREDAHRIIRGNPKHVDCAYIPSGDRIKLFNGSLSDFRQKDDGSYWFEDQSSRIAKLEEELKRQKISCENKGKYDEMVNLIGTMGKEISELKKELSNLSLDLENLQSLKENDTASLEKKVAILERSVSSLHKHKQILETGLCEKEKEKSQIIQENERAKAKSLEAKKEIHEKRNKIEYFILGAENSRCMRVGERKRLVNFADELVSTLDPKPKVLRSAEEINCRRQFVYDFKAQAKTMDSPESIEKDIILVENELKSISNVVDRFEKTVFKSEQAYKKRILKREEIRNTTTLESTALFKECTMKNGYLGEMDIDHENKRIDIKMKVHNTELSGSKSTLSGGERSFAFICFLLSMWKCFRCPIRILDEFDVFMDAVNRKMAIRLLFEFFKTSEVQAILITPLDTEDLIDSECDIKILKKIVK